MVVSSAPGRFGIIGNPTDMYGGSVISCSLSERAQCGITQSSILVLCTQASVLEMTTPEDLQLEGDHFDVPKAVLLYFGLTPENSKVRLTMASEIPESAGLAGSTAMVVAVIGAVLSYLGEQMDPYTIAEAAREIEYRTMGVMCGYQDQHMAVFGGLNYMDFRGKGRLVQDDAEPLATVEPLQDVVAELPFVVAHTGITRNSGVVHQGIREAWERGEPEVVEGYERIADLARQGKKALIAGDWERLGELMNENHDIQRKLGGSGPQNEHLIEAALSSGALGSKLAGAGNGGTIVALTLDPDRTVRALREAGAETILWPRPTEGLSVQADWRRHMLPEAVSGI